MVRECQKIASLNYVERKTKAGYKQIAGRVSPKGAAAYAYLVKKLPGGFNLTKFIEHAIVAEAEKHGFTLTD